MRSAVAWFAENHVAANILMLFILVAGVAMALQAKVETFPETELDRITVSVAYPGASPSEVEEGILRPLEEAVAGLAGVDAVDSVAREGAGVVTIEVLKGYDTTKLYNEAKAQVDRVTTLPEEAERPVVTQVTRQTLVINVAVYGDVPEATLKNAAQRIKDEMTRLPDVSLVKVFGIRPSEIHVEISEHTLRRYNLTLGRVAAIIRNFSMDLPAGGVTTQTGEVLIRAKGKRYHADQYAGIPIVTRPDGAMVPLGRIAKLSDGFADVDIESEVDGKPGVMIQVYRIGDQNALDVAAQVKAYLAQARASLPAGLSISTLNDMSDILKSRLELLLRNLAWGLLLVGGLLALILHARLAFWVTLGIPVSFCAAFLFLPSFDVSINMISLFAFIMVLGIVVDDAIVVGENIFRKYEAGMDPLKGAVEGALEVGRPVIFSVLTTMVAFYPLLLGGGSIGKFMRNLPVVVILVLAGSLAESLFILPAHLARSKAARRAKQEQGKKGEWFARMLQAFINGPYARGVRFCLRWRYVTLGVGLALLVGCFALFKTQIVQFRFFPDVEGDVIQAFVTMPSGTPLEQTMDVVSRIERVGRNTIRELDKDQPPDAPSMFVHSVALVGMQAQTGGPRSGGLDTGSNQGQIWIQLSPSEQRSMSASALTKKWRQAIGPVPEAESVTFTSSIHGFGKPIEFDLSLDDQEQLEAAADLFKQRLASIPGVYDVEDSFMPGKMEMQLSIKPAAKSLGLSLEDLARQARHAFYGAEALRFQRGDDEVKVLVRYPEALRESLGAVQDMRITTPSGKVVPFGQVAEVHMERGYSAIERSHRRRIITVSADVNEDVANSTEIRAALMNDYVPELRSRFPGLWVSVQGQGKEMADAFSDVLLGGVIALFGVYVLLAIPFKSFSQPVVVMLAIPFGLAGAVLGHLAMGMDMSIMSVFGMVGLAGVVVNDSLVLIYQANTIRRDRTDLLEAVAEAGQVRFRAIILTSLTTFAGLAPMLTEQSLQARFLIPMAVSLGFGVLFSTLVTLLLVPAAYMGLEDLHKLWALVRDKPYGKALETTE
ncbi:MAG: efflux RND transporter permease subunit [Deltaproteobacteria bacterium]|nr:efflux RND transporter permease subunit [Deltaproteobacteria bacterium]